MSTYNKTVWQDGDIITADKMNNIENGIYSYNEDITNLETNKQDALTFDQTPTAESTNPVTSVGIKNAIEAAVDVTAPGIYETASSSIASFSDGADDMPMKSCVINIEPIQEGEGDPSPENVRPISGRTELSVVRTGKNLLDTRTVSSGKGLTITKNADGSIHVTGTPTGTWIDFSSAYDHYIPTGNYTLSLQSEIPCNFVLYSFYEGNTNRFTNVITNGQKSKAVSFASNVDRIFIGLTALNTSTAYDFTVYPQLEIGSTATDYEPYKGSTYSVNWETEAGTVYGGTLDVVSGKLVVDRATETITKDSNWYSFSTGTGNSSAVVQLANMPLYVIGSSKKNGSICSSGLELPNYWTAARQNEPSITDNGYAYTQNGVLRFHRLDVSTITTLAEFKSNFPDTQVCYLLATPTEIQLTPQEVRTLLGENNIWSDAGDVSVDYPADTKTYIDDLSIKTVEVTGQTPTITAEENTRYICGEVTSLTFTTCESGICDVRFTAASISTVLTLPETVKLPDWFDPTALEANATYEINVMDGIYGAVMSWA